MSWPSQSSRNKSIRTVLSAGLVAGILDALAASILFMIRSGKSPVGVWQFVASGVFGQSAFDGGAAMVVWGLVFHFFIALLFASLFFLIYPFIREYVSRPAIVGLLYGLLIWLIMNRIVLPLSNTPAQSLDPARVAIGMAVLMVFVGLPIALIVNRHYLRS